MTNTLAPQHERPWQMLKELLPVDSLVFVLVLRRTEKSRWVRVFKILEEEGREPHLLDLTHAAGLVLRQPRAGEGGIRVQGTGFEPAGFVTGRLAAALHGSTTALRWSRL